MRHSVIKQGGPSKGKIREKTRVFQGQGKVREYA